LQDLRASFAWRWKTAKGTVSLNALTVSLDSESVVQKIRFYSTSEEAAPLLVAVTGVSSAPFAEALP